MARIKHYNPTTGKWEHSDISSAIKGDPFTYEDFTPEQLASLKGVSPKLSIGTVTTLSAGSNATATLTGTDSNPVLNLGLPKGESSEVFSVGINPPSNTKLLWIDTTENIGGLKYYNGTNWTHVPVAFTASST